MKRRSFLAIGGGSVAGGLLLSGRNLLAQVRSATTTVIETDSGRIRGRLEDGVHIFKGVRYGAPPLGGLRFMPPSKPQPWTGVLDTFDYGLRAPQPFRPMVPEIGDAMTGSGPMSEDCLRLNVWTPQTGRGDRPVMLWLHGGGFRTGSGNSIFYDGKELARKHDAVVVTLTHRLNALGFLYLSEIGGDRFRDSANLGMQDIVLALEWVRDNIAAFGGNPGNVTVFGQSGGGGKTSILHGMPSAKGLFHRAIIMSTLAHTAITALERDPAIEAAERLLARLELKATQADELQSLSMEQILAALTGGSGRSGGQLGGGQAAPAGDLSLLFTPVVDGRVLTVHPFEPGASRLAATVPVMCGSNETEGIPYGNPDSPFWTNEPSDFESLRERIKELVRVDDAEADGLIALYRKNRPNDSFADIAAIVAGDMSPLRLSSYIIAERKVAQNTAPVYMYYFKWRSPVRDAKLRSMHCMEIPFIFDHVDDIQFMTGTGEERYPLAQQMSEAWVSFARNGNPNHSGLPDWPEFTTSRRATMVFDTESRVVNDPYGEERRALQEIRNRGD